MRPIVTRSNAPSSYEPTVSGYSQMPEDRGRERKAIVVKDPRQYDKLRAIEEMDPIYLEPWGRLPDVRNRDTGRFLWQRRTPEWIWPYVWCRINGGARDVVFEVQFSRDDYCVAHVLIESWEHHTCDAEAVRAAIQQDYLNRLRNVPYHFSIVKRGMKSLSLSLWDDLKNNPRRKWFKPLPVPSFAPPQDERPHYRSHHSLSPISSSSSSSSSRAPQGPEVYVHRHRYDHHHTSEPSSASSDSSRTLVESDYSYEYEGDYSDTSSSTATYYDPPPPLRSEKHGHGLDRSSRSDSDGSSIYSERRRGWRIIVEF